MIKRSPYPVSGLGIDFQMVLHPEGETVSDIIRRRGCYSRNDLLVLSRFVSEGGVLFDVGANIGWHTAIASNLVGSSGAVYAFEPDSANFRLLNENISLNRFANVVASKVAVADKPGQSYLSRDFSNSGNHALRIQSENSPCWRGETAVVVSLDERFLGTLSRLDFVKIDAQGAEPKILNGMSGLLERYTPIMLVEFSPRHIRECGNSPFEFLAWLEKSDFLPFHILDDGTEQGDRVCRFIEWTGLTEYCNGLSQTGLGIDLLLMPRKRVLDSGLMSLLDFEGMNLLARSFFEAGEYEPAISLCRELLVQRPGDPSAISNLSRCLVAADRIQEGIDLLLELLRVFPHMLEARVECSLLFRRLGEYSNSKKLLEAGVPFVGTGSVEHDTLYHHLGWHELLEGDFKNGIKHDRLGRNVVSWGADRKLDTGKKLNSRSNLKGARVLVFGEGGFGDEFISMRFARILQSRGARVMWITDKPIHTLLERVPGIDIVCSPERATGVEFDFWVPAVELVSVLEVDSEELWHGAYVQAEEHWADRWKILLKGDQNLKIGLRWAGARFMDRQLSRGVSFQNLETLFDVPGTSWFSLQNDELPKSRSSSKIADWGGDLRTWEDTCGAIEALDLVISTCTAVAHLAGAMGKPVWLLCPAACYYTWVGTSDHTPWYPETRLFRQPRYDRWDVAIANMKIELERRAILK